MAVTRIAGRLLSMSLARVHQEWIDKCRKAGTYKPVSPEELEVILSKRKAKLAAEAAAPKRTKTRKRRARPDDPVVPEREY